MGIKAVQSNFEMLPLYGREERLLRDDTTAPQD
jgi:hypothetical protein